MPRRWSSLRHAGLQFPTERTLSPGDVEVRARGKPVVLSPRARRFAARYACLAVAKDSTFRQNFWKDWSAMLPPDLARLSLTDFAFLVPTCKALRGAAAGPPCTATVDGKQEAAAGCKAEGEGIFIGRGRHPLRGRLKRGILPEDVTLNLSRNAKTPPAPKGHRWEGIVHKPDAWWLTRWQDPLTQQTKYTWLAGSSDWKARNDKAKFDRARALGAALRKLRGAIGPMLRSSDPGERECGVVLYLLDKLALRVGSRTGDGRVVGLVTLQAGHVRMGSSTSHTAAFDFAGKDSIRYRRQVVLPGPVWSALAACRANNTAERRLFPHISAATVNAKLKQLLPDADITAKAFRTYHASSRYQEELRRLGSSVALGDAKAAAEAVQEARLVAARLCNHVRGDKIETATAVNNYLDPRITFALATRLHVDHSKLFTPAQLRRFSWARAAGATFSF